MKEFLTACPRNCYSKCSFRVLAENGKIVRILPYDGNKATPEGPCVKGWSYIESHSSPKRIIHPMIRDSAGKFRTIPMDEALDLIASKLSSLRSEYGSKSILWYKGSGMSGLTNEIGSMFWKAFGGATTTYGDLCWPAGLEAVRLTMGSVKHNVPWDLVNARLIVIWGKNPAETNIQETAFLTMARENGCRIIVIDPIRTPTADKSDQLFSPLPGTDAALALAIARIIVSKDLIDKEFVQRNVKGFEEFKDSLLISSEQAEAITGIPSGKIEELAELIGTVKPMTIIPGYGLQRHTNGGQTIRAILALSVLTGNIGKPGAGFNYANLQSYVWDKIKEPLSDYPDESDAPFRRTVSMAKLGTGILNTRDPEIKAIWVERGNPVSQSPDTNNVLKAFGKMSFKVVVEQFMSDTASMADVILPAKDLFEQSDIIGSYWSPYVQMKPKIFDPPGDVMPESEIYFNLAERLGLDTDIPLPGNDNIESWLIRRIGDIPGINLGLLKKGPVLPASLQHIAYEDLKFETRSGKIELYSEECAERWKLPFLPGFSPLNNDTDYPMVLLTPNTGSRIHSQFGNLDVIKNTFGKFRFRISPQDASSRNIVDGQKIRVFNSLGEVHGLAEVSNRISPGIVVFPNGISVEEGVGINRLIAAAETDMGFGSAFHDNRVEIEGAV